MQRVFALWRNTPGGTYDLHPVMATAGLHDDWLFA